MVLFPGELTLGQTHVICKYVGKQLGLYPESEVDELHAEQVHLSIHDCLTEGELTAPLLLSLRSATHLS